MIEWRRFGRFGHADAAIIESIPGLTRADLAADLKFRFTLKSRASAAHGWIFRLLLDKLVEMFNIHFDA